MVGLGHAATHWIAATFYLLLPWIKDELEINYLTAGTLVSVFHLSSFIANFASGALTDITGRRVIIQSGSLLLGTVALGGASATWSVLPLAFMIAVIGATNNAWHPAAISYLSRRYPSNRGYALSIHALGANIGDAVAPLAVGAVLGFVTWHEAAFLSTLPVLLVSIWLWMFLGKRENGETGPSPHTSSRASYLQDLKRLLNYEMWALSLMSGLRAAAQVGLLMFVPIFLADTLQAGPWITGLGFAAMQLGGIIASPVAGAWSDRIGRRPIVVSGLALSTIVIFALSLAGSRLLFISGISVLGFVLYGVRPVVHSWAMDLAGDSMGGSATSLVFGMQSVFSVAVPVLAGAVADRWDVQSVFWTLAAVILASNLIAFFLPGKRFS